MPKKPTILGERVKAERERLGLTGNELSRRAGIDHGTLWHIENDPEYKEVRLETVRRLAEQLEVSIDYLAGVSDVPTPG